MLEGELTVIKGFTDTLVAAPRSASRTRPHPVVLLGGNVQTHNSHRQTCCFKPQVHKPPPINEKINLTQQYGSSSTASAMRECPVQILAESHILLTGFTWFYSVLTLPSLHLIAHVFMECAKSNTTGLCMCSV
jgi:hypothetical protein